jgi:hypothetical protein
MKSNARRMILGCVAIAAAGALAVEIGQGQFRHGSAVKDAKVWFYDEAAKRLYAASAELIPPDGSDGQRVRATVIRFLGMPNDKEHVRIAYLEKYTPELKGLLERAEAAHAARRPFTEKMPPRSSPYYQDNTLLKSPGETSWQSLSSEEAHRLKAEWHTWRGPDGQSPMISEPDSQ